MSNDMEFAAQILQDQRRRDAERAAAEAKREADLQRMRDANKKRGK